MNKSKLEISLLLISLEINFTSYHLERFAFDFFVENHVLLHFLLCSQLSKIIIEKYLEGDPHCLKFFFGLPDPGISFVWWWFQKLIFPNSSTSSRILFINPFFKIIFFYSISIVFILISSYKPT